MTQTTPSALTLGSQMNSSQRTPHPGTEFFKEIVRNSGIKLSSNDDPNKISQEQALVGRDMHKLLDENDSEESIEKFMKGFKTLIKKEKYMRKALLPTQFARGSDDDDVRIQQESLFRIFLKVPHLQNHVIDLLLAEITSDVTEEHEDTSRLRLLLGQLRYLPHIKNPESLTGKLLDVIEIAPYPAQLEILDSIPEILPDSEYGETAEQLGKMLGNEELSGAIIDCLNALNLDPDIRAQVQDHILSRLLTGANINQFPTFLEFLMTDYKAQNLSGTFVKIRNALDSIMASPDASAKIVVFVRLQSLSSKTIAETWLSVMAGIKAHSDHKPVDLLILFMLHSSGKIKKRNIELAVRKKVKEGTFRCSLLEQFFEKYLPAQLLRDYFASIIEVGVGLLRSSGDANVIEFAATLFKLLFKHPHSETVYRQEILDNLVLLAGSEKNVTCILNIFASLLADVTRLRHHTLLLMRLLEQLDRFELKDIKLVFEILCTLTCSDESLSGLKEELHMVVRKQLSSSNRALKRRGIVAGVVLAKRVAATGENRSEPRLPEDSLLSVSALSGSAREAAAILELTRTAAGDCPELLGLYYDQLAAMLATADDLDAQFFAYLDDTVTDDFNRVYVTAEGCEAGFERLYSLNADDEQELDLAVNVAEVALRRKDGRILILAPHFRLLRLLHYRQHDGDLATIDALLGCAVVLPDLERRENLEEVADCVFHCINWFREVINGFVTQKDKKLRLRVIQRLDNLIELEKMLQECLEEIPSHRLPSGYSSQATRPSNSPLKRPRKKLKTREVIDDTTAPSTSKKPAKLPVAQEPLVKFREMDTDLVRLLKYPLAFDPCEQTCLNINQLNFILRDLATKLALLTKGRDLGLSHLNTVEPLDLMTDCVLILTNINKHFSDIVAAMEKPESVVSDEIQNGFGLVLEILALVFDWSGFQHSENLGLLRDTLRALHPTNLNSVNRLVADLVARLAEHHEHCLQLSHAVYLIRVLEALHALSPTQETRSKIAKISGKLLNKRWNGSSAANIDVLIKSYLSSASTKTLCGLVGTLQDQAAELKSKSDTLAMLQSVDKANFYVLYRDLWACLHERVKTEIQSLTNNQHLTLWKTVAQCMQGLMSVAKSQESKTNLVCFLKQSIAILKVFLSHGIPILEIMLKSKPDQVVEIFKDIQSNTRFLHYLCCYSKVIKSPTLIAYVPQFRLTLETLVYRVKAALVANGCSEAFWLGNLKNRDLYGEEILSQASENSVEDEDNEDEEMVTDDEDMEDKSASEVYE